MQKIVCTFFLIFLSYAVNSQEITVKKRDSVSRDTVKISDISESVHSLKGRIISITDKEPLQSAHVVNLNSVQGTITNVMVSLKFQQLQMIQFLSPILAFNR